MSEKSIEEPITMRMNLLDSVLVIVLAMGFGMETVWAADLPLEGTSPSTNTPIARHGAKHTGVGVASPNNLSKKAPPPVEAVAHADDEVVLIVNTNRVTWKMLKFGVDMRFAKDAMKTGKMPPDQALAYRNNLFRTQVQMFANQYVALDEAVRLGLTLSTNDLAKVAAMAGKMSKATGLSESDLRAALPTPDFLVREAERMALIAKLDRAEVLDKIAITSNQVAAALEELKKDADACAKRKTEVRKRMEGILRQVKDGGDFAALAKVNSEAVGAGEGGAFGTYTQDEMEEPPLRAAAFALKPGDTSGLVRTQDGYCILKALAATPATFDEDGKLTKPATVQLAWIFLSAQDPVPIPKIEEIESNLRMGAYRQGKTDLTAKLKAAAHIQCPLFPDIDFLAAPKRDAKASVGR
jgi:hypothetical protein